MRPDPRPRATGAISYRYDQVGNRTNRTSTVTGIGNQASSYNTNDWLTTDSYDANGNTTNGASIAYQYDWANRLTNANAAAVVIVYDGDGNRVKKVAGGATTLFLVDRQNPTRYAQVLEELTVSGVTTNLAKAYTYGLDLITERAPSTSTNFFGYDGLGSTRFLLNPSGAIVEAFAYDAYGNLIASNGVPSTAYLYAGEQWDPQLNLSYLRKRYNNPSTGRFLTLDSYEGNFEDTISLHKYLYCQSDPVNRVDASGLDGNLISLLEVAEVQYELRPKDAQRVSAQKAFAISGIRTIKQVAALSIVYFLSITATSDSSEDQQIELQTDQRLNPTGSKYAYVKYKCDEFAEDAEEYFSKQGDSPERITYFSIYGKTVGDNIVAVRGFFAGQNISYGGFHRGILVKGIVFDNNLPFGVPRAIWETSYEVRTRDTQKDITIGEAHRTGYGQIIVHF